MKKNFLVILSVLILSLTLISCTQEIKIPHAEPESQSPNNTDSTVDDSKVDDLKVDEPNNPPSNNTESSIENIAVRLYFYNAQDDTLVYYDDTIEVTDKALTTALINALKNPSNPNATPLLPQNIDITSAKLDKENNLFTLDFPSDFVSKMGLGSGAESMTLKAIVNTIGYNFKVNNIIITLGGKPYSSGHILMEEGESFKVDLNEGIQLN